ncbi:hypothetical protein A5712_11220 [Mycobacterium sp. E2327]|uniref:PPE family protein n=1 Tax=Mycobacterium sp. E2327 TaxID=1834132 RepID=UPI000800F851|nr:PPE family protein [Mycobacterium sp. E2327]OBI23229.1 hypothetical protein A5712_11220 [Mycobacterium sp. E2327]
MLDFGALPPEINSGRIYAGPGSGSMMAAASAWDGLASELSLAATGYSSVITELTSAPWLGPASRSMLAAATPYVSWLGAAAALAEDAANQARAAAAAFETAFTLTVPPPVIAANRVLLATLIATNFFGQNFPAIAATEAQYAEMWAQDAVAMYGYAAASATATQLTPFTEPAQATDQGGLAAQAVAVAQAVATPAGTGAPQAAAATPGLALTSADTVSITSVFTSINQALQQLSAGALASQLNPYNWWIVQQFVALNVSNRTALSRTTVGLAYFSTGMMSFFGSIAQQTTFGPGGTTAGAQGAWYATPQFAGLHLGAVGSGAAGHGGIAANLSSATKIGGLSVPQGWAGSPGAIEESAAHAVAVDYATDPQGAGNGLLRGMPMGTGGRRSGSAFPPREYGFRRSVLARPPSAG